MDCYMWWLVRWKLVVITFLFLQLTQNSILEPLISAGRWRGSLAGRSGLAVTCLTAVWEDQGSNPTVDSCMLIVNITTIYSLGHGLCTLTAVRVPRSTQPSTLRGMVKWVSAFELSNNNKWRWWVWLLAAYRRTHSPGRLVWSESRRPLGAVPHSSYEPGELSQ